MSTSEDFGASYKKLSFFGPKLGFVKLNSSVVDKMIDLTDGILNDDTRNSHGSHLAGQIAEEPIIDLDRLKESRMDEFINQVLKQHVSVTLNTDRPISTQITDMWIVSQYENEYNPVHWHEGCTLSCVMYLKIPEYTPRNIQGKSDQDGKIVFINNNPSSPHMSMESPLVSFSPEVGDLFIFPSRLLHCVYPFIGDGERRSVSFNAIHYYGDSETKRLFL